MCEQQLSEPLDLDRLRAGGWGEKDIKTLKGVMALARRVPDSGIGAISLTPDRLPNILPMIRDVVDVAEAFPGDIGKQEGAISGALGVD